MNTSLGIWQPTQHLVTELLKSGCLCNLMLDIVNDLIENDEAFGRQAWDSLANIIRAESEVHQDQVEYWALLGEPIEDAFRLTPLARELLEQL